MGKTEGQKLEEKLCFKPQHIAKERPEDLQKAIEFAEGYKTFLDHSKATRSLQGALSIRPEISCTLSTEERTFSW